MENTGWPEVWINVGEKGGNINNIPDAYGIYRLQFANKNDKTIPIERIAGIDTDGIVYIGRSGWNDKRMIKDRIMEFFGFKHSGGYTYYISKINKLDECSKFKGCDFRVQVKQIKKVTEEKIVKAENKALAEYFCKFGELPPFNSSFPKGLKKSLDNKK